ncbi:hypothetical protein JG688_00008483 [Phytophthora aleatoria]|uniref:Uncharacterized protein n=1 Tax=Phytophthora aleatoria TaxID=2496075 RepID=A0A8J5IR30_9STRA|nr:hypothetical protein JG688_00008483 [Phytophthora aleatoria]
MKVPLIGCASHRINLSVVGYMESYEDLPIKLPLLMRKLRCLNASTSLRRVQLYIFIAGNLSNLVFVW